MDCIEPLLQLFVENFERRPTELRRTELSSKRFISLRNSIQSFVPSAVALCRYVKHGMHLVQVGRAAAARFRPLN